MPDTDRDDAVEPDFDEHDERDEQWRELHGDDVRAGRRYRPGRGGFDPQAAALAARTKYARRQRVVLIMLIAAATTAVLAGFAWSPLWWLHALVDLSLVGYLTYLRRQVRIEEEVRSRRLARMSGAGAERERYAPVHDEEELDEIDDVEEIEVPRGRYEHEYVDDIGDLDDFGELEEERRMAQRYADAVVIDIDDEDPMFDELDERTWEPYRRAAGE